MLLPLVPEGASLPRIIHQAYLPETALPAELRANIDWIRNANPDWEHRFYGEDDVVRFVRDVYGRAVHARFERINPQYQAVKVDLFRYLLMYKVGGVYMDAKSRPLRPLREVLKTDERFILSQWRNGSGEAFEGFGIHPELRHLPRGEFQQWHIVASPGHPFLRAAIKRVLGNLARYNPALHGSGQHGVLRLAGPIAYALAIAPIIGQHAHRRAESSDELGFQYSVYGEGLAHRAGAHYSDRTDSIMRVGALTRASEPLIRRARALKQRLRGAGAGAGAAAQA